MRTSRRSVLRAGTALMLSSGLPAARPALTTPVRMAVEKFSIVDGNINKLVRLFSEMRKKPASDPSSYFFQGAVHWFPDVSGNGVQQRPERRALADIFNADPAAKGQLGFWSQCTHNGVKTPADFLLWHRAYLYYFERHARRTLNDDTFALPYWDYRPSDPGSLQLPMLFRNSTLPDGKENPLFPIGGPQRTLDAPGRRLDGDDVDVTACMRNDYYFSESGFAGFGDSSETSDSIDHTPHGLVHGGIGGWMRRVETAAFDPIFWVHHANIDRLFNRWQTSRSRYWARFRSQAQIDAWLDATPYTFIDSNGQPESKSRRFFLNQSNLGYVYDTDPPTISPPEMPAGAIFASATGRGGKSLATVPSEVKGFSEKEAGALGKSIRVPASTGLRFGVALALPISTGAVVSGGQVPMAVTMQSNEKYTYTVIDLEDVRISGNSDGNYAVFVGPLSEAARDTKSPSYVGRFSTFDVPDEKDPGKGKRIRFDITRQLEALKDVSITPDLAVRILPIGPLDEIGRPIPIDRSGSLYVGNVVVRSLVGSTAPLK